jgi:hypothetical protein
MILHMTEAVRARHLKSGARQKAVEQRNCLLAVIEYLDGLAGEHRRAELGSARALEEAVVERILAEPA